MKDFSLRIRDIYTASREHTIGTMTWGYLGLAFVVFAGLMTLFVELVDEVREGDTMATDEAILRWFENLHTPWLDSFVSVMTDIGGTVGIVLIMLTLLGLLVWKRKYRVAMQLGVSVVGAVAINLILKNIFTRDRPALWEQLVTETSYSFPSGHAMASSALALSLVLIFWQTRYRWLVVSLAGAYTLFVGSSRLYLGVHYPTDIIGGWTMSAIWVIVVAVVLGVLQIKTVRKKL